MRASSGAGIEVVVFEGARVEPTLESLEVAAAFARDARVDGFVSVGGGSSIDTAKVANLIVTQPAPVMEYVNAPVGAGRKPPAPLLPHLAIPTTSGTGSEATTVAVLDIPSCASRPASRTATCGPSQAIVDPDLARTLPARSSRRAGLDVVCHAAESLLARRTTRARGPRRPTSGRRTRARTR